MKQRIIGIDLARCLAVFGMIIVNFKIVLCAENPGFLEPITSLLEGKAAATFVVLAGIGIALMTNNAIRNNEGAKLLASKKRIIRRAIFLFLVGLSYIAIWPADILHFYGGYMLLSVLLIGRSNRVLWSMVVFLVFLFPFLLFILDYEMGWDWTSLSYEGFWTIDGFIRNFFFNGFHPVIPWTAFMIYGIWFGRQDLRNDRFIQRAIWISLGVIIAIQCLFFLAPIVLSDGSGISQEDMALLFGTEPMPPLPIYMFNGMAVATLTISICIKIGNVFGHLRWVEVLVRTGSMALTFYVAHVIIGMGLSESWGSLGSYTLWSSIIYALAFCIACVLFAMFWSRYFKLGPLEWLMRKITG